MSHKEKSAIEKEVLSLLHKRAIEEATGPGFYSQLFTVPKKTGDLRPVLNLRPLNRYIQPRSFKMETLRQICHLIKKGDYMTPIDLSDAFLHVLIHPSYRKYLRFEWKGRAFQFRTLPFGLSLSPLVFTKILKPVLRWARRKGITIFAYLDDILIIGPSRERTQQYTQMVLKKLAELGFLVKESKSTLEPTQTIEHLGFTIDTKAMTLSVPKAKTRDLRREASKLLSKTSAPLRTIAAFVGKAMAMTMAVFPARMMTRQLTQLTNQALRTKCKWTDPITISQPAQEELRWWKQHLSQWNGQSFIPQTTDLDVYTDSSDNHWGIVIDETTFKGAWSQQEAGQHINWKELRCIWLAVNLPQCIGRTVNIVSDNMTAISYINKFGGTKSDRLLSLAMRIWQHCLRTGTRLRTTFVPSLFNPADAPSRQMTQQLEWSISQDFFHSLDQRWGPHHVDLFASHLNHKVPRYVSWKPHPTAYKTDALQHRWHSWGRLWICPPWNLIPRVLHQIREERLQATVITPNWEGAMWFPTVKSMAVCPPVPIPRSKVLAGPGHSDHVLDRNHTWALTAWNIDGGRS